MRRGILVTVLMAASGPQAVAQAAPIDMCPGLQEVLAAASGPGLASLAPTWSASQSYAAARKPAGYEHAVDCQVVRGERDQFDCRWYYVDAPDSRRPSLSQKVRECLAPLGWRAEPTENDHGARVTRFTKAGGVEVQAIEADHNLVTHSDRLSVTAPAR
jgi:hypothetical protein